jgi:hypothetical protein
MNAICIDMRTRQRIPTPMESDDVFTRRRVLEMLKGRLRTNDLIGQAQVRAIRSMQLEGIDPVKAIQRAVAWAVCEDDRLNPKPDPPEAA